VKFSIRTYAEAVPARIMLLRKKYRDSRIAASYRAAYAVSLTGDEVQMLDAAAALAGDAL
jgi:hypothetical protein